LLLRPWSILFVIEKLAMSSVSLKGMMEGEHLDEIDGENEDEDDERTKNNSENALTFDHGDLGFSFFLLLPLSPPA
jgi:hypothetical protein